MTDKVDKIRQEVEKLMYGFNFEADIASCEDAEAEKKEWIEKACKWLEENVWGMTGVDYSALSDSFCQAMEEML